MKYWFANIFVFIVFIFNSQLVRAYNLFENKKNIEAGVFYLSQANGGNTTTVIPTLGLNILNFGQIGMDIQAGVTAYKLATDNSLIPISIVRLNPIYHFANNAYSISLPVGMQWWSGRGIKSEFGIRFYCDISSRTSYFSEAFVGYTFIKNAENINAFGVGFNKFF